jgi:hypothetical protein
LFLRIAPISGGAVTRKELELALVRVAEKYPDRVGLKGIYHDYGVDGGEHCMIGMVDFQLTGDACPGVFHRLTGKYFPEDVDPEIMMLFKHVGTLNDSGMPWGQIVKELGLVPGEQPAEELESQLEMA